MIEQPFHMYRSFADRFVVGLFTKEDDVQSDAEAAQRLEFSEAAGPEQVHGNLTISVDSPVERTNRADGMTTATSGLLLCTRSADCQSFIVFEPNANVCGVLHVGWRGLIADAISAFFQALTESFHLAASDTYVACGPSLCQKCAGFSDPSAELPTIEPRFIDKENRVDLQGIATEKLRSIGVSQDRFERHPDCTCCRPDIYWTYRGGHREAVRKGHTNMLCCGMRVVETLSRKEQTNAMYIPDHKPSPQPHLQQSVTTIFLHTPHGEGHATC